MLPNVAVCVAPLLLHLDTPFSTDFSLGYAHLLNDKLSMYMIAVSLLYSYATLGVKVFM